MKGRPPIERSAGPGKGSRILIVYPHNFTLRNSGINTRYYELLRYFTGRGFLIDVLGLRGFVDEWPKSGDVNNQDVRLEELFLYDFQKGLRESSRTTGHRLNALSRPFRKRHALKYRALPDFAFNGMRKYFDSLVSKKHYDFILISYAYWANLIKDRSYPATTLVLEISDFLTLNLFDAEDGRVDVGALMNEELHRVDLFDKVFCINEEEQRFFSRLARRPEYFYVPHFMERPRADRKGGFSFDACIVASDNPHNIKGVEWFYRDVMPLLPPRFRYLIVGKIVNHLPRKLDNVTAIPFAEDLREVYGKSRIALCPLLGGTGMKIKVVEALAYGLPVVCTSLGVMGFSSRELSGCSTADDADAFARHIQLLLGNEEYYTEQSKHAISYFMNNCDQAHAYGVLDRCFTQNRSSDGEDRICRV
jgi:glycosyltransferase involved in cell wall biosynthesis